DVLAGQDVVQLGHVVPPRARDLDVRRDGHFGPTRQVAVDRIGALLAVTGGLDQRRRTGHEVAAGEDTADVRGIGGRVDLDPAAVDLEARLDGEERQVRGLRHGRDDDVGWDRELAALDRHRRAAARSVRLAKPVADEPDARDVAILAQDLDRAGEELHPDALALGLAELLLVDADRRVEPELDAEPLDEPNVHLDRLARQAEGRDADEHRPAAVRQAVEDGDPDALHRELASDRETGRSGTDDRDALRSRGDLGHDVGDAGRLVPLHEEALHGPDGERPIDVAAAAGPLAGRGAYVRAHRRGRVP